VIAGLLGGFVFVLMALVAITYSRFLGALKQLWGVSSVAQGDYRIPEKYAIKSNFRSVIADFQVQNSRHNRILCSSMPHGQILENLSLHGVRFRVNLKSTTDIMVPGKQFGTLQLLQSFLAKKQYSVSP